jgi:hypothetical protein
VTACEFARYYRETGEATFAANSPPTADRPRRNRRSHPQRWQAAINELISPQAEYADWLTVLPDNLENSATAAAGDAKLVRDIKAS